MKCSSGHSTTPSSNGQWHKFAWKYSDSRCVYFTRVQSTLAVQLYCRTVGWVQYEVMWNVTLVNGNEVILLQLTAFPLYCMAISGNVLILISYFCDFFIVFKFAMNKCTKMLLRGSFCPPYLKWNDIWNCILQYSCFIENDCLYLGGYVFKLACLPLYGPANNSWGGGI